MAAGKRDWAIVFYHKKINTVYMDLGQQILILGRLVLGALAAFFAIMLWSRTRDTAWMLIVIGIIAAYAEIAYSILEIFGISSGAIISIGSKSLLSIILPCLPMVFFISALAVMVVKKYRQG